MRCKKHPADTTSSVGVCASCLSHRLLSVMAAQAHKEAQARRGPDSTQQQQQPPPPSFPRSVSPYISRRKSDATAAQFEDHRRRFYSTPQVGFGGGAAEVVEGAKKKKKSGGKRLSSLFFGIFRSKSDKHDLGLSGPISDPGGVSTIESQSWFSGVIRRKKQIRTFSLEEGAAVGNNRRACRDRGMSPARFSDEEDDDGHCRGGSSGYSSEESSVGWRQTPRMTPAAARRGGGGMLAGGGNLSGLAFCLSPLVRASPNRRWNQKVAPPEAAAGESRVPATAAFCKNRSRKLADFGRYR